MNELRPVISEVRSLLQYENGCSTSLICVKQEATPAEIERDGDNKFNSKEQDDKEIFHSYAPLVNMPGVIKVESVPYDDQIYEPDSILRKGK